MRTGSDVDVGPVEAVRRLARHQPEAVAIAYEGTSVTYRELAAVSGRLAAALAAAGVERGDRVAYLGLNSSAFLVTYLATAWLGAVFVPVNSRLTPEEAGQVLRDSGTGAMVAEPGHQPQAAAAPPLPQARRLLVDDDPAAPAGDEPPPGWTRLSEALAAAPPPPGPVACHEAGLAMLVYTSGTTGQAKGVPLRHGTLWWNSANLDALAPTRPGDVNLVVGPLFHTAPLGCFTLRSLARGGTSVLRRSFDAARTLADLVELRVNTFFAVPAMYAALARLPGFAAADLSALRTAVVAGAPAPPELIERYAGHGVALQNAYGLTETLFATCVPAATQERSGSVGVPLPYTEIRLVEPGTGRELDEPGARGEVCLRGPTVTPGYWRGDEATAAAFDAAGWFHSGDVGHLDEAGYLYVVDRLKDLVIVGGDNVYPTEVERVLARHPGVREVAVVGMPDPASGERVVAVLACEGEAPTLAEVRRLAGPHLAAYKLPTRLHAVEALPRNAMGKIDRKAIRAGLAGGAVPAAPVTAPAAPEPVVPEAAAPAPVPAGMPPSGEPAARPPSAWRRRLAGLPGERRRRLVLELVVGHVSEMLEQPRPLEVTPGHRLDDLGLGSLAAVELSNRLNDDTGLDLPTTLLFDHPTTGALADHLCTLLDDGPAERPAPLALVAELARALASQTPDDDVRALVAARLRTILADLATGDASALVERVDAASDDELFDLIDHQLGPPDPMQGRS